MKKHEILHYLNNYKYKYIKAAERERSKIDTANTQIHDSAFSWLGTGTLI